jgi:restriction system protein
VDAVIHHYPPDVMQVLINTIPRLVKSKPDVFLFFRGAGVDEADLRSVQRAWKRDPDAMNKYAIARELLTRMNDRGEELAAIRARREIIKRVCGYEDFSGSYANDRLAAKGLVAELRGMVREKDAFTRMQQAHDAQSAKTAAEYEKKAEARREKEQAEDGVRRDLFALFSEADPWKRGKALEGVLNRLFRNAGISVREAFTVRALEGSRQVFEQIDGAIVLDGDLVLVEVKWEKDPLGVEPVARHCMRVFGRPPSVRGLLISQSGVTEPAAAMCREHIKDRMLGVCELRDLVMVVDQRRDVEQYLRDGFRRLALDKRVVFPAA